MSKNKPDEIVMDFTNAPLEKLVKGNKSQFFQNIQHVFRVQFEKNRTEDQHKSIPRSHIIKGDTEQAKKARALLIELQDEARKILPKGATAQSVGRGHFRKMSKFLNKKLNEIRQPYLTNDAIQETVSNSETSSSRITIPSFKPKNVSQAVAYQAITDPDVYFTFLEGDAGGGKSYAALSAAFDLVKNSDLRHLVIIRPDFASLNRLGALPGSFEKKTAKHTEALNRNIKQITGKSVDYLRSSGQLLLEPYNDGLRGISFPDAVIIIDDGQSMAAQSISTIVTRMEGNSRIIVTGDISGLQDDHTLAGASGMPHTILSFSKEIEKQPNKEKHVAGIHFGEKDSEARHIMLSFANAALANTPIIEANPRRVDQKILNKLKAQREDAQEYMGNLDKATRDKYAPNVSALKIA